MTAADFRDSQVIEFRNGWSTWYDMDWQKITYLTIILVPSMFRNRYLFDVFLYEIYIYRRFIL